MEPSSLVLEQLYAFLEPLALGAALGACFDLYRALRLARKCRLASASSVLADCLFWVGAAVVSISVIVVRRWGELYFYTYLALGMGFSGYIYFLSRFMLPIWVRFFGVIISCLVTVIRFLMKVYNLIASPFRWAVRTQKYFIGLPGRIFHIFRRKNT